MWSSDRDIADRFVRLHGPGAPAQSPVSGLPTTTARLVYYSGTVQGVGFRSTAADLAHGFPVTGWVKNLVDGRVQLCVEGSPEEVRKFLDALRQHWKKNLTKEQVEESKPTGTHRGFRIIR